MATLQARTDTLEAVLDSISPQLTILYVYLNDHSSIPNFFSKYKNIVPILASEAYGDLSANGKMFFLEKEKDGIAFTLDDDFIYPKNYVKSFFHVFEKFHFTACLCVHGSLVPENPSYYYERNVGFDSKNYYQYNHIANLIGSGTCAFPIKMLDGNYDFRNQVFVDLQISLAALRASHPIVSIARPEAWVTDLHHPGLWEHHRETITHHTRIMANNKHLFKYERLRKIWHSLMPKIKCEEESVYKYLNLSPESVDFLDGKDFIFSDSAHRQLKRLFKFSNIMNDTRHGDE